MPSCFNTVITKRKKYTSGPRYWNVPVLVNTGTFLVYQYCLIMWYLRSLERAGVIQKLTILERKNGLVLSNTHVPVSGTWSILFPTKQLKDSLPLLAKHLFLYPLCFYAGMIKLALRCRDQQYVCECIHKLCSHYTHLSGTGVETG